MKKYITTLTLGILFTFGMVSGQTAYDAIHITENEEGFGTRALAMGGAYTALANDYSGIYWNPAGLGSIDKTGFYADLSHLQFSNDALYMNNLTSNNQGFTKLKSLGFVMPLPTSQGSFVIAGGFNRVLDYDDHLYFEGLADVYDDFIYKTDHDNGELGFWIEDDNSEQYFYPFSQGVYKQGDLRIEGSLRQWSLGGALALSPNFTIGLTTSLVHGKEEYNFGFSQFDDDNLYYEYPGDFDEYTVNQYLLSDYYALNLKLGGMVNLSNMLSVGGVITLPSKYYIEETHSFSDNLFFDDGTDDPTEDTGIFDYHVKTPFIFDVGMAFSNKLITLSASARYRDWSQTRFEVSEYELDDQDYRSIVSENNFLARDYDQVLEYRVGGEVTLPGLNTKLRTGYTLIPSPLRDSNDERITYSAGISFKVDKNVSLDFSYLKRDWTRDSWDIYTPAGVNENIEIHKILVGLTYNL
jgi:long-subunit fatty acid transport protein